MDANYFDQAVFVFLLPKIVFNIEAASGREKHCIDGTMTARVGFSLKGSVMKTLLVPSLICCAQHCLKESRCISTNFKFLIQENNVVCELNDAALLDEKKNNLSPEDDDVFSQYCRKKVKIPRYS